MSVEQPQLIPEGDDEARPAAAGPRARSRYAQSLGELAAIYQKDVRTLKRWVSVGRDATPRDLPPLDQPRLMAAWWRVHCKVPVPDRLIELEAGDAAVADVVLEADAEKVPVAVKGAVPVSTITLEDLQTVDGAELSQARQLMQSAFQRLAEANLEGNSDAIRRWTPIWKDCADQVRKADANLRTSQEKNGQLVNRSQVIDDISQLLQSLRVMREAQPDRIVTRLQNITRGTGSRRLRRVVKLLEAPIREAILAEREKEDTVLRSAALLNSPADIPGALAAA